MDEKSLKQTKLISSTALTKDDIISILEHNVIDRIISRLHAEQTWLRVTKIFVYVFTTLLALVGLFLAWGSTLEAEKANSMRTFGSYEITQLTDQIKDKQVFWHRVVDAIMDMRKAREMILLKCRYNKAVSQYDQDTLRFQARYNLALAATGGDQIINGAFWDTIHNLTHFDNDIVDVCAKNGPSGDEWQGYLIKVNQIIGKSIQDDRDKIRNIEQSIMHSK